MALENAKKFITQVREDETLQERTANRSEEEVMAVAKEIGLDFTAEELKEAAGACELTLDEMNLVAGGGHKFASGSRCPKSEDARHHWECTGHEEEVWFGWLKKGGLFSRGFDNFKCVYCGKEKSEKT